VSHVNICVAHIFGVGDAEDFDGGGVVEGSFGAGFFSGFWAEFPPLAIELLVKGCGKVGVVLDLID